MDALPLHAVGLSASYGRVKALDDVDLLVQPGRALLLLGDNGAGKSTALALCSGERAPQSGRVRVLGRDPREAPARRALMHLDERIEPPAHLSCAEAVATWRGLWGLGRDRTHEASCLERMGIMALAKRRSSALSKGQRRRLELAMLLAVDPPLWILDEPQSGLDPSGMRLLRRLLLEAKERGRALLVASHALSDVGTWADDVVVLRRGRVHVAGTREELSERVAVRTYGLRGDPAGDECVRTAARAAQLEMTGPELSLDALESLLFDEEAPAKPSIEGPL